MTPLVWLALALGIAAAIAAVLSLPRKKETKKKALPAPTLPPSRRATEPPSTSVSSSAITPSLPKLSSDDDEIITRMTFVPGHEPTIDGEDDETTRIRIEQRAIPILFDDDAALDEPTGVSPLILVSAAGQSDPGRVRKKNEDSFVMLEDRGVYVVADGMGGHAGGEIASRLAVDMVSEAFETSAFIGKTHAHVPRRGGELVLAIQMANHAIFEHARSRPELDGMGTTLVAARFSPNKQRVYVGHVGDSRCYRLRGNELRQMTTDHNLRSEGMEGIFADRLSRAVGVEEGVKVDLIIARPLARDRYLLCSDGLSKMVDDERVARILIDERDLEPAVAGLIAAANEGGGRDNITVILVEVRQL
jgi:serine/threonine protein phosphatase PrpC